MADLGVPAELRAAPVKRDVEIPAGKRVLVTLACANRDSTRFDRSADRDEADPGEGVGARPAGT